MKVFIDTNILVDLVCAREGYVEAAKEIFALGYEKKVLLVISPLSYINTFYIGRRYKYDAGRLINVLRKIESFTKTSDFDGLTIKQTLLSGWTDIEDASQYFSARDADVDIIVTRNAKDFKSSLITVLTPNEFHESQKGK